MTFTFLNVFSQEQNQGNREPVIFYPTIDKTEKNYNISVDLFELGTTKYVEAELYNENDEKITSKFFELRSKGNKYFLSENDEVGKEVSIYDINFKLENPDNNLAYPKLKIKMLNSGYQVIDYSQKIFY